MNERKVAINRAPVLTLWAAVVAERLGFEWAEALSLGKAVSGLTAQSKGRHLGIFQPTPEPVKEARRTERAEELWVALCGRAVPAVNTPAGVRAVTGNTPIEPAGVERYLRSKFGEAYDESRAAMTVLAAAFSPDDLAKIAFRLYERFRPQVPPGVTGWGAKGVLDLDRIRSLAR